MVRGFTENLEDTGVPALAHISHDSDSERPTKVAFRKHSIQTHFPKDGNCKICSRTKTHWRSSTSSRKVGGLITAGRKVLNKEGESRNNHRYAVVVQDLVTQ